MPKDTEKYQYFTVGLLKSSFALEALNADAAKHHMVEQPAKLIALRLTEYYDLLSTCRSTHAQCVALHNTEYGKRFQTRL